jgi:hypothetical protein
MLSHVRCTAITVSTSIRWRGHPASSITRKYVEQSRHGSFKFHQLEHQTMDRGAMETDRLGSIAADDSQLIIASVGVTESAQEILSQVTKEEHADPIPKWGEESS